MKWGAGTVALSVDGGGRPAEPDRSIWDDFCRWPDRVADGSRPSRGSDFTGHLDEDLASFREAGLGTAAFTVSWSRIEPTGRGRADADGLGHYDRLVDRILDAGLTPLPTLHHWDLPAALENMVGPHGGGWLNRDTIFRFRDYACTVAARLGDRLETLLVMNDPARLALEGYGEGRFPPGRSGGSYAAGGPIFGALHHQTLAVAATLAALRGETPSTRLGTIAGAVECVAADDTQGALDAAEMVSSFLNHAHIGALTTGRYTAPIAEAFGGWFEDGDTDHLGADLDVLGVDPAGRATVAHTGGRVLTPRMGLPRIPRLPDDAADCFNRSLADLSGQEGLKADIIAFVRPGSSMVDQRRPGPPGGPDAIDDADRADRLAALIASAEAAPGVTSGIVRPFLDGFEPVGGLADRQGLIHVDHATHRRMRKRSWHLLARHLGAA